MGLRPVSRIQHNQITTEAKVRYDRIKANYTQAVIEPRLREQYEKLVND